MVQRCNIENCSLYKQKNTSFHRFPKNKSYASQWRLQVLTKNKQDVLNWQNFLICNWHFKETERKYIAGKAFLLPNAIPTLNFPNVNIYDENVILLEHQNSTVSCGIASQNMEVSYNFNENNEINQMQYVHFQDEPGCSKHTIADTEVFEIIDEHNKNNENFLSSDSNNTNVYISADVTENMKDLSTPPRKPKLHKLQGTIRYPGDINPDIEYSPRTANLALKMCHKALLNSKKKVGLLRSKVRRRDKRIDSMGKLISQLKQKFALSEHCRSELEMNFSDEILRQLKSGKVHKEYSSEVKSFACTLNFYSSSAYEYVRRRFGKHLPSQSIIKNWYRNVEANPGTLQLALDLLKSKVESEKKQNKSVYVALMIDEMSIKQQKFWDDSKKEWHGLVDFGTELLTDGDDIATKALVFMVNSTNEQWKLPVAYYFTHSMQGSELASLVNHVLEQMHETGVVVMSITFDGPRNNIKMAEALGGQIWKHSKMKTSFQHPTTKQAIFLYLDIPHMIKLVRNMFGNVEIFYDGKKNAIKWEYIVELEKLQRSEGLMAGNNLRKRHINFKTEKMKVKLATQTLSDSVADALTYCDKCLKLKQFQGCQATVKFIKLFNRLFDIFNSRNMSCRIFKKGIDKENAGTYFQFFDEAKQYIKTITLNKKKLVINSKKRTGFIGFLTAIESTQKMFQKYVENGELKYLLMHKFSQDPLESTFSVIRSKRGSDDSPNTFQFKSIMKRILYQNELKCYSKGTNSLTDDTPFFNTSHTHIRIGSRNKNIIKINESSIADSQAAEEINDDSEDEVSGCELTPYVADVVIYICSLVERRLKKQVKCEICLECLNEEIVIGDLTRTKADDELLNPQKNVVDVCRLVERGIRSFDVMEKCFYSKLKLWCFRQLNGRSIFENMNDHILDQSVIDNHKHLLISSIIDLFLKMRMHHIGKMQSEELITTRIRNKNKKIVHFKGQ